MAIHRRPKVPIPRPGLCPDSPFIVARHPAARTRTPSLAPDLIDPVTWNAVEHSRTLDVQAYPAALLTIHRQGRLMAAFHERYDVILSPTLATLPPPLGVLSTTNPDLEAYGRAVAAFMPFTQIYNMTGQPSVTVPLGWSDGGLPIGVMFSAPYGDEATLFRLAAQLERARPWFDRKPEG